jgi:dipeptidyl aminopeptidase/acylaminoacyl peptidase
MTPLDQAAIFTIALLTALFVVVAAEWARERALPPGSYLLVLAQQADETRALTALGASGGEPRTLTADAAAFSAQPGGRRVAVITRGGALSVFDAATGETTRAAVCAHRCADPAWRPVLADGDGDTALVYSDVRADGSALLRWLDVETQERRPLLADPAVQGRGAAWSADGARLAFYDPALPGVRVFDTGRPRAASLGQHVGASARFALSPDGAQLAYFDAGGVLVSAPAMGGKGRPLAVPPGEARSLRAAPSGWWLVVAQAGGPGVLWAVGRDSAPVAHSADTLNIRTAGVGGPGSLPVLEAAPWNRAGGPLPRGAVYVAGADGGFVPWMADAAQPAWWVLPG